MNTTDRRSVIRLAIGAALAPALASRGALAHGSAHPVHPPSGSMIYTRTIERFLPGNARMTVRRDFSVRFVPTETGFVLEGRQVDARVDAPVNIAALARLEQQRSESGIFPLELDRHGRIIAGAQEIPSDERASALAETLRRHRGDRTGDPAEVIRFVEVVHQTGQHITSELPEDLFAPAQAARQEQRQVPLPGGDSGVVTTSFRAAVDPSTGLMREASREVVTAIGTDRRRTVETWQLRPA